MNVLLTNDDGVSAPGLWAAARALAACSRVTVVAPATDYSGYGPALPPRPILHYYCYQRSDGHPPQVRAYGIAGTPATCAHVGLSGVFDGGPFDLVVSGINLGANIGFDVFYSGTVGAALTAHLLGVPAIAVSLAAGPAGVQHWDAAAWAICEVVRLWQHNHEVGPAFFNVNVPNVPQSLLAGLLVTSPGRSSFLSKYRFAPHPHDENALAVTSAEPTHVEGEPWTDGWALELGYVAVTPLRAFPDLLTVLPLSSPPATAELSLRSAPDRAEAPEVPNDLGSLHSSRPPVCCEILT